MEINDISLQITTAHGRSDDGAHTSETSSTMQPGNPEDMHDVHSMAYNNSESTTCIVNIRAKHSSADYWTEAGSKIQVQRRTLKELDVAALMLNKMMGTGIFTTPGVVLALTKSRVISIFLWALGGLWTSLMVLVYLEFGNQFPHNGGELIYLDRIYSWNRVEMLATILFSGFFLVLGNSYGNSIAFAKHVLLAADPSAAQTSELDSRLIRFIAIALVTIACLVHYFSSEMGRLFNKVLFLYKITLLITVFCAGAIYFGKHQGEWKKDKSHIERGTVTDCIAAMLAVCYTYTGWENANYVAGEIEFAREHRERKEIAPILRRGAFIAVSSIWVLYVLVTVFYYYALDFDSVTDKNNDIGMVLHFAPKIFGNAMGMKVCIAISAAGHVLAFTYTSAKVKQAIALQQFLPFWNFFASNDKHRITPQGALVLHWISNVIVIAACPVTADGYIFITGLFTYGQLLFSGAVAFGIFVLRQRMDWSHSFLKRSFFRYLVGLIFFCGNGVILGFGAASQEPGKIPRFWWPVILSAILGGSSVYWAVLRYEALGSFIGIKTTIHKPGQEMPQDMLGTLKQAILESNRDGTNRRLQYEYSGISKTIRNAVRSFRDFIAKYAF